jgi:hypothetical protein
MDVQIAEPPGEVPLLLRRQRLFREEQHLMVEELFGDEADGVFAALLGKVEPLNEGTDGAR